MSKNKEVESMIEELEQLGLRISTLNDFMHTDEFAELPQIEFGLSMVQIRAMRAYHEALLDRMRLLKNKEAKF